MFMLIVPDFLSLCALIHSCITRIRKTNLAKPISLIYIMGIIIVSPSKVLWRLRGMIFRTYSVRLRCA